jgi:hypothetical protein
MIKIFEVFELQAQLENFQIAFDEKSQIIKELNAELEEISNLTLVKLQENF